MGIFLHKNVKPFNDFMCFHFMRKNKNYTVWMPPFICYVLNIYPKVCLGKKNNCLLPNTAELLRWEPDIVFFKRRYDLSKKGKWLN